MNNKGQTLVLFLFLFPVVFFSVMIAYDFGMIELDKKKVGNEIKEVLRYGYDNRLEDDVKIKMLEMFEKTFPNIEKEDITIDIGEEKVTMTVKRNYRVLFFARPTVKISYSSTSKDGKVQIIKE